MASWDSEQYLKFSAERSRPAEDLAARIAIAAPDRIIDLGCGPGNSTAVLARRWPNATLAGLDQSDAMIKAARQSGTAASWETGDIANWTAASPVDVVFSNAALQWVTNHAHVLPRLLSQVSRKGAFAFQVPANFNGHAHRLMREIGGSATWRSQFVSTVREWHVEEPSFYYDTLAPHAAGVDLWTTEYIHILPDAAAIVEWYRGTGLRPWLDALPDEPTRTQFLADYLREIERIFPRQIDGRVLFPFERLFVIAYR